jgi:hypothetical protein
MAGSTSLLFCSKGAYEGIPLQLRHSLSQKEADDVLPRQHHPNPELRQRRWLKRTKTPVPQMINTAEKEGGIAMSQLGKKRLSDGRLVAFTLGTGNCVYGLRRCP